MSLTLSPELQSWVGRTRVAEETLSPAMVARVAGMLDFDPGAFRRGDPLPPHWFNIFFSDATRQSDIGPDGHPAPGVILPPIPLPRRMGASRRATIPGTLHVGDTATRTAEVVAILPKQARTGFITILTMRHTIRRGDDLIATEEFDAIYREAVKPGETSATSEPVPAPRDADWKVSVHLSSALVFRYSAITWNAHRIHYDADYARDEEGYPNTVQNGGLTMQLALDAAVKHTPGRRLAAYGGRLTRPLHVGATATFAGRAPDAEGRVAAWVEDADGFLCGQFDCEFR